MSLRAKIALWILGVLILYCAVSYGLFRGIVQPGFEKLERDEARLDMARAVDAFRDEAKSMGDLCLDYSGWDATYNFVVDHNQAYVDNDIGNSNFLSNVFNLYYLYDAKGHFVWGRLYSDGLNETALVAFPQSDWAPDHPLLRHQDLDRAKTGFLDTELGPLLLAAAPVVTSEVKGPIRGTLIIGRFFRPEHVKALAELTKVDVAFASIASDLGTVDGLPSIGVYRLRNIDDGRMRASAVYPDIHGVPAFRIEAAIARTISQGGKSVTNLALGLAISGGIVLLFTLTVFMRTTVVEPLRRLQRHVARVQGNDGLPWHPALERSDEIGALASEFNAMAMRIQEHDEVRRWSEQSLADRELRLRTLLESAPDGIISVADGLRILSSNRAAQRIFGYPEDELMAISAESLLFVPDGESQAIVDFMEDALREQPIMDFGDRYWGRRKDGSTFPAHLTVSRVHIDGSPLSYLCIVRDISDLQRMQDDIAQHKRLAEIGEMGASVAHEIRNPVAGISGAIQVLRDRLPADDPGREVIAEALEYVARIEHTIRYMLMFAKKWEPIRRRCRLADIVGDAAKTSRGRAGPRSVRVDFDPGDSTVAFVDPALVQQVIENLFANAFDAIGHAGTIHCIIESAPGIVRLRIRDTGPGIPREAEEKAFKPFFTTKTKGTGLGLGICRQIMEAHNGTISLSSGGDEGTEAILEFPGE